VTQRLNVGPGCPRRDLQWLTLALAIYLFAEGVLDMILSQLLRALPGSTKEGCRSIAAQSEWFFQDTFYHRYSLRLHREISPAQ
jgi:hypothetical protein